MIVHLGVAQQLSRHGEATEAEAVWSVDKVMSQIRMAARTWSSSQMSNVPDPRFTYEQEASPEEFFTPYIWLIVSEQADYRCICWTPYLICSTRYDERFVDRVRAGGHRVAACPNSGAAERHAERRGRPQRAAADLHRGGRALRVVAGRTVLFGLS